jgi:peptide/nickel transport system permease protein
MRTSEAISVGGLQATTAFVRKNPSLVGGLTILAFIILFGLVGSMFVDIKQTKVGAGRTSRPPSAEHPLGTDAQGRDMFATLIFGTPQTLKIGFIAGAVGLGIGIILGFLSGYFRGFLDNIVRIGSDVLITVPALAILIIISSTVKILSVEAMALVIASLAWMWPTRTIRSQVLTLRERTYVQVARLSGMNGVEIIFRELIPNLLPYLAASFVGAVGSAILASIGLSALGLGPQNTPTLGLTIYWALLYTAFIRGMWWWWGPPVAVIVLLFVALFLVSTGLDQIANPRLRRVVVLKEKPARE